MSHLDEGTLHALLDGELELAEVREIQTHLGTCSACDSRLQDVKQFLAEADRLVGALEAPAGSRRVRPEPAPVPSQPITPREATRWEAAPELLLPDPPDRGQQRRWTRTFRWAAMILVIFGAGRLIQGVLNPDKPRLEMTARDLTRPASPPPVVRQEDTGRPQSQAKGSRTVPVTRAPLGKAAPSRQSVASQAVPAPVDELGTVGAAADALGASPKDTEPKDTESSAPGRSDAVPDKQPTAAQDLATRQAAANALEELDRERLRSRANAATASLPPPRAEVQPAAEPPPAPRTLEQRAQVYLRIGLDEAVTQLGRPVHVIEAMTPEFIGLTLGRLVPGADPNRPVVRVVYLDRGRMVLLDQQRLRTGQGPGAPGGNLRWAQGDVMLYLHGEPGPEVLRNLQRRVR